MDANKETSRNGVYLFPVAFGSVRTDALIDNIKAKWEKPDEAFQNPDDNVRKNLLSQGINSPEEYREKTLTIDEIWEGLVPALTDPSGYLSQNLKEGNDGIIRYREVPFF